MSRNTTPQSSMEEELDSEITSIRAELRKLHHRRRILSSSLLASDKLQTRLKAHQSATKNTPTSLSITSLASDISPLADSAGKHSELNHHRVAFSATTFPFTDPSPTTENPHLLGVRIDVCTRSGRYTKPYYILLKRARTGDGGDGEQNKHFQIHRHTIPAFIAMDRLERRFLPVPSSATEAETEEQRLKPWKTRARKQDLWGLVRELRRELVAWHLRKDAVGFLREKLGVVRRGAGDYDDEGVWVRDVLADDMVETRLERNELGIIALSATTLEATYVRVEWEDGRVGRFKISNSGIVERAVILGDQGRDKAIEGILTGGDGRVETVLDRLKKTKTSPE
ncbi:hypothetical protein FE257_006972 [Aspergillus nanangensis]|uniref:Uncharacterized protein n=1 Tax=Aspergillus nanangensis TaxID=2582783 RepID=A0AAD4CP32_ASPNN|nr:hypothetical protein FE257_006972 [Aspergillus nanangensis]